MIYTITLNPAVDVSLHVREGLLPGSINQSFAERTDPGGKGINVSKTLKVMGQDSVICVGICGEDGDRLLSMLKSIGSEIISVRYPAGNTRTNIKITGENGVTTDINGNGPQYDKDTVEELKNIILSKITSGDTIVISGRPPLGSPSDIYAELIRSFKEVEGVKVILDAADEYLREGLAERPYAVKPTCEELCIDNDADSAKYEAGDIVLRGVTRCLISMGVVGAVFASRDMEATYTRALDVKANCTTGCGDAMTAGLAYASETGMSSEDSFRLCMALAGAEAETEGTNPPTKERVMELFNSAPISGQ
ncbi:MAG: hexose kinase [Clostridiales bacterium]|jgi:1-phosphofructokinase|nr:hexose kinase [Clostridiales bacterium]